MHVDFYDLPQYVGPAVTKISEFLANHLEPTRQPVGAAAAGTNEGDQP